MRSPAPAAVQQARGQSIRVESVPAPIGGWNARDPLAAMAMTDAVKLVNWVPREGDCTIRGGCIEQATGFTSRPRTLALHTPPGAVNKMFAATNEGIYDVTIVGAIGAAAVACSNGLFQWTQMGVSGGHYLMMFNGVDEPRYFDGTIWITVNAVSTPAITGIVTTKLISATVFKRRLFLVENNSLDFWYLPVDQVGGAAVKFPLGPLCSLGGFLMAIGTWTIDGGSGPDDFIVFLTSEGEAIIFQGTDPSASATWALVGAYKLGARPLGRRCIKKYGGDLVIITEFGALPLAKSILSASISYKVALTDKIQPAFVTAAKVAGTATEGWDCEVFPAKNAFVFNVPILGGLYEQYVMNTVTKAWCRFKGWNGSTFVVFNEKLYFADANRVAQAWIGQSDYGADIVADAQTAFSYFGLKGRAKDWTLMRPKIQTDGSVTFSFGLAIDFDQSAPLSVATYQLQNVALWDVALWDVDVWSEGLAVSKEWLTPLSNIGYCAAGLFKVSTKIANVNWIAMDYGFIPAGVLG